METKHTFEAKELTTDDSNFKPFTGELPSRLQMFAERALARYEKMSPMLREQFEKAVVCTNSAALRTAYTFDMKNNPLTDSIARAQEQFEAANDPVYKLKHAA